MARHRLIVAVWTAFFCTALPIHVFPQQERAGVREQRLVQIQQMIAERNLAEARRLLDEAAQQFPADAGFDNLLGIVEAQQGDYRAAEESFRRAIKSAPRFTGAYLNLGRLYQQNPATDGEAPRKALDVYRQLLRHEPEHAEANYQSATLLMRRGAYRESLEHLSRLSVDLQNSAPVLSVSCADYAGMGHRARADDAAARLIAHPHFSEADAQTVLPVLTAGGRDDLSIKVLEVLLRRQTLTPALMHALGLAYERTARLAEARDALEKSSAGEKPGAALLWELARVAHKQQDYKGALGYIAHARELEPNNAGIHYSFGLICVNLNLLAEAHAAFGRAVSLEPDNSSYNYAMGAAAAFRHDPGEAIPYFQKYLKLNPHDPRGRLALGAALFRAKDYDAAAGVLAEAAKHPENAATAHFYLGSIARQKGHRDVALRELASALKAKPDYPDALAELGQVFLTQKNYDEAGKRLRRALEINPHHYTANFNLLTLYTRTKDEREAAQAKRFAEVQKLREEKTQEFLRLVEVRPFASP